MMPVSKIRRDGRKPAAGRSIVLVVILAAALAPRAPGAGQVPSEDAAAARQILDTTGVRGGLVVHLGCGDGTLTAALHANDSYLVHGLDADAANVQIARAHIRSLGLSGPVSVEQWTDAARLPYVDNLVRLLVVSDSGRVSKEEMLRVLCPGGVAVFLNPQSEIRNPKLIKPWPADIDQWSHFLHGPDGNAVAADKRVDMPRSIQWVSEPQWGRSHEQFASMSATVTAGGRVFFIVDEAPLASIRFLGDWKLVARDAFNGTLLWKRDIARWVDHLRHFRSGPAHLPRRLVATGDTVYATLDLAGPVVALDAATGRTLRTYAATEYAEEIVVGDGVLYLVVGTSETHRMGGGLFERGEPKPSDFRYLTAFEAESGKPLWKKDLGRDEFLLPLSLAVKGKHAYFASTHGVVCLDAASGKELWRVPRPTPSHRMGFSAPTLVATDEVLLFADQKTDGDATTGKVEWGVDGWNIAGFARQAACTLTAYDVTNGKELWSAPCKQGYNSPPDVFVFGNTVRTSPDYQGYDLKTGQAREPIKVTGDRVGMPHHRCYRDKATERFILTGRSGIEMVSLENGWQGNNSWIRGTCQYGIMPANGMLYAPPDACACYLTVKVPGFFAAAPARPADSTAAAEIPADQRLEKGPAYGPSGSNRKSETSDLKSQISAADWPMYRHDPARSGMTPAAIPTAPKKVWSANVGGRLTQPVIAGGTVYVASVDAHTVHALSAADGKPLWAYTAGGRIDSAPTVYKGTLLFGAADGWVYCLDAATGRLAWRFLAAPRHQLVGAYGQLESTWPVHGSVLVQNDTIYVTAGRSSYLDGGIRLYRLDPLTGKELSRTTLYHLDPKTGKQLVPESGFNMEGTLSDILSGDGERVYLKYFAFDRQGERTQEARPHLFAIASLLGEDWFYRSYWTLSTRVEGAGWSGWANTANKHPFGRILCFNADTVYGYGRQKVAGGATGHKADAYHLFSRQFSADAASEAPAQPKGGKKAPKGPTGDNKAPAAGLNWSDPDSLIVRAMVAGDDKMAVVGTPDVGQKESALLAYSNPDEALAAFEGKKGVYLRVVSAPDGKKVSETALEALPVFDGMAAADGRLYVALKNGCLVCLGKE